MILHEYDYQPKLKFFSGAGVSFTYRGADLYFGLEIETQNDDDMLDEVDFRGSEYIERVYAKRDGSLGENGVEFVTHPATKEIIKKNIGDILKELDNNRYYTDSYCGSHVHINKNYFSTQDQIKNIIFYVNYHKDFFYRISNRSETTYCSFKEGNIFNQVRFADLQSSIYESIKYMVIRPTNTTLEFRLFKGTLSKDQIMQNLELIDALVSSVGVKNRAFGDLLTLKTLVRFIKNNRKEYPLLNKYLAENKINIKGVE